MKDHTILDLHLDQSQVIGGDFGFYDELCTSPACIDLFLPHLPQIGSEMSPRNI